MLFTISANEATDTVMPDLNVLLEIEDNNTFDLHSDNIEIVFEEEHCSQNGISTIGKWFKTCSGVHLCYICFLDKPSLVSYLSLAC